MVYRCALLLTIAVLLWFGLPHRSVARLDWKAAVVRARETAGDDKRLVPGVPFNGTLAAGETHSFTVEAEANQFVRLVVAPMDVDFSLAVYGPDKELRAECRKREFGETPLSLVADKAGSHRVEIKLLAKPDDPMRYEIRLDQQREILAADRVKINAEQAIRDAERPSKETSVVDKLEEALRLYVELGDQRERAYALTGISLAHYNADRHQQALAQGQEALQIWQSLNEPLGEAKALYCLGVTYHEIGRLDDALSKYSRALELFKAANSLEGQARCISVIGFFQSKRGDHRTAIDLYSQSLDRFHQLRNLDGEVAALNGLGRAYFAIGYYKNAGDVFSTVLRLTDELQSPRALKLAHSQIGDLLLAQGESRLALERFEAALAVPSKNEDLRIKGYTLHRLGLAHQILNHPSKAADYYEQALDIHRKLGNKQGEAVTLNRFGSLLEANGRRQEALEKYRQALSLGQAVADSGEQISSFSHLAHVLRDLGQLEEASANVGNAIALIETTRQQTGGRQQRSAYLSTMQEAYSIRIDLLMQQHDRQMTEGALEAAARSSMEALLASDQGRARALLESIAEAQADIRKDAPADTLEREKELQRQINLKAEQRGNLFNGISKKPEADRMQAAEAIDKELRALSLEYDRLEERIRSASPHYAGLVRSPILTADEIKKLLDDQTVLLAYSLGDKRSYLWAVTRDSVDSYTLPARKEIEAKVESAYHWLTAPEWMRQEGLESKARQAAEADAKYWAEARVLSRMLLGPVAEKLRQMGQVRPPRLLVVNEGALQHLSFAALPEPEKPAGKNTGRGGVRPALPAAGARSVPAPLIASHEVIYLPSISVLAEIRKDISARRPAPKMLALYADPIFTKDDARLLANQSDSNNGQVGAGEKNALALASEKTQQSLREMKLLGNEFQLERLRGTKTEAEFITPLVPPDSRFVAMNADASLESVKNLDLAQYRVLHLATHGLVNKVNPDLSSLVFSLFDANGRQQNGYLRMHEIYNLKLNAEVVVLSACESADGKEVGGEGLMALSRGFFYAGARRVVASLWSADDHATPILMREFYQQLIKKQATPAEALRAAQIAVQSRLQWKSPYYWAGFTLQGDFK